MITVNVPIEDMRPYDEMESELKKIFKSEIYEYILKETEVVLNSAEIKTPLQKAIEAGTVRFNHGEFSGNFNSQIVRELRAMDAKFNRATKTYKIRLDAVPDKIKMSIKVSESRFLKKIDGIKKRLKAVIPAKVAGKFDALPFFSKLIGLNDDKISRSLDGITVSPKLTDEERAKLAAEYTTNFERSVKGWTETEVEKLRDIVKTHADKGLRADSLIKKIERRFQVSQSRAKFIARQETRLVVAKFREMRYEKAGTEGYIWKTVLGTPASPVRPMHAELDGKFFSWDNPPVTNKQGNRNHPGEDYNCRCRPKVVVRF